MEIAEVMTVPYNHDHGDSTRQVYAYVEALRLGSSAVMRRRSLNFALILELHGVMLARTNPKIAGVVRSTQVYLAAPSNRDIRWATYVPPSPDTLAGLINDFDCWLSNRFRAGIDPVVATAISHAQMLSIHPFVDGNGRISRILSAIEALDRGILTVHTLSISPFLSQHRSEYYDTLTVTREGGGWEPWIDFFVSAVMRSLEYERQILSRLEEQWNVWEVTVRSIIGRRAGSALRRMTSNGTFTVTAGGGAEGSWCSDIGITQIDVEPLAESGVVTRVGTSAGGDVFAFRPLIELAEGFAREAAATSAPREETHVVGDSIE